MKDHRETAYALLRVTLGMVFLFYGCQSRTGTRLTGFGALALAWFGNSQFH